MKNRFAALESVEEWYGIVEFNVPIDTVEVICQPWAVMCISHSVTEGQQHNPLNPPCFCLQRPKREEWR